MLYYFNVMGQEGRPRSGHKKDTEEQNRSNYFGFTPFWIAAIGPWLGHQWGVKQAHPGQQGRQRGATKTAQTLISTCP